MPFEIVATISGIIAVFLQAKEKILAWPFAIISVGISVVIFYNSKLYSDFGLHIIYIFLNLFGWYTWNKRPQENSVLATKVLSTSGVLIAIVVTIWGCLGLGYAMHNYTDADLPFYDAFTTSGSLVAQYLLAKKYLQNWLLWIVVDLVAIPLYIYKGLYFFAFLFLVYLLICIYGYMSWRKEMLNNSSMATSN